MTPRIEHLAEGKVILHAGDCLDVMPTLAPNLIDSCATDPPYGLGFMGKHWDHGVPGIKYWREVFRVLKPGAHLLSFGGTRTYHHMACAIEDAGFEIRDSLQWLYGSGFPKSHDVSKGIDKAAGIEFEAKPASGVGFMGPDRPRGYNRTVNQLSRVGESTDSAREWQGWGTALKPACEPIVLARKPLSEKTVAANVLKWGTGAINIDGCRVATAENLNGGTYAGATETSGVSGSMAGALHNAIGKEFKQPPGRWPANVIHDGSDEVVGAFPDVTTHGGGTSSTGFWQRDDRRQPIAAGDSGSAARFFYTAKADSDDRLGSKHPTVKPLDLMQYLVRLVTPPKGWVLDPFAGTGTTGESAFREGMRAILIERETEYQNDIRRRMSLVMAGSDERAMESVKAKTKDKPVDHGPLFGGTTPPEAQADRFTDTTPIRTNDWSNRAQVVSE